MPKNILVTGGCGFIGSHFIRYLINNCEDCRVFNLDNLSYAGDLQRLKDIANDKRYYFVKGDIRKRKDIRKIFSYKINTVVHFAAESHVDNSIKNPFIFEEVNAGGTLNLLDIAREYRVKRFLQISTDEVYGEIKSGRFNEESPLAPNSPYSASKAAADFFVRAYIRTYSLPAIIIRPSNNYGSWQYPEKFIPVVISSALKNKKVPVYAKGQNRREWLYVLDCVQAIAVILAKGRIAETYNVGSGVYKKNIDVAKMILKLLGRHEHLIEFVKDRPGHDWRYALDFSKIIRLGWKPKTDFNRGIFTTVDWYRKNFHWAEEKMRRL
jgi:dTDP-glucose 4,6-dehydratase